MDLTSSTRTAENRTRWQGIVAKSSVVPKGPYKIIGWTRQADELFSISDTFPVLSLPTYLLTYLSTLNRFGFLYYVTNKFLVFLYLLSLEVSEGEVALKVMYKN